jgi:hypothetical protein
MVAVILLWLFAPSFHKYYVFTHRVYERFMRSHMDPLDEQYHLKRRRFWQRVELTALSAVIEASTCCCIFLLQ